MTADRANQPKQLLRYLLIATVLVVSAVVIVAGYANRERLALKIKSVYAPAAPKPVSPGLQTRRADSAFIADARWAFSALPECFTQQSRTTGPGAYVLPHLPKDARRVAQGSTIFAGDCRAFVHGSDVWVWRGKDRLRIPPPARLYESGSGHNRMLELLQGPPNALDLRVYSLSPANGPST